MSEFLKIAAQYTFIIQAALFPLLILFSIYMAYWLLIHKRRITRAKEVEIHEELIIEHEVLKPLKCTNCGSILVMNKQNSSCMNCGSNQDVPPHYAGIFKHRADAEARIAKAYSYWKRAQAITSPVNRGILLLLFFWFIAVFIILIATDDKAAWKQTDKSFYYNFLETFGAGSIATLFFWAINFLVIRGLIGPKLQIYLPEKTNDLTSSKSEVISCSQCAAPVYLSENSIGACCQYCGTETYRVHFAKAAFQNATKERENANFSLIEAMQKFEEKKEEVISSAIILPLIFVVLPAVLVCVFYIIPNLIKNGLSALF
ncbi:MAG: hypothetical protein K0R26_1074 [Bacteroidota bacterium]|jgi:hypothetical protein|nr:hypothetical protein [Bacteroidota bacterium]